MLAATNIGGAMWRKILRILVIELMSSELIRGAKDSNSDVCPGNQTKLKNFLWQRCLDFRQCFFHCYLDERCSGFWYTPHTSLCQGHAIGYFRPDFSETFYGFCRKQECPISQGYITMERHTGLCVKVHREIKTWEESRRSCLGEGADLMVVNTKWKHSWLRKYLATLTFWSKAVGRRAWIGMRRYGDTKYQWVRGKVPYVPWGRRDPSYGEEECVQISSTGIGDVRCDHPRYFICEICASCVEENAHCRNGLVPNQRCMSKQWKFC